MHEWSGGVTVTDAMVEISVAIPRAS
jgi:hypothetical protein